MANHHVVSKRHKGELIMTSQSQVEISEDTFKDEHSLDSDPLDETLLEIEIAHDKTEKITFKDEHALDHSLLEIEIARNETEKFIMDNLDISLSWDIYPVYQTKSLSPKIKDKYSFDTSTDTSISRHNVNDARDSISSVAKIDDVINLSDDVIDRSDVTASSDDDTSEFATQWIRSLDNSACAVNGVDDVSDVKFYYLTRSLKHCVTSYINVLTRVNVFVSFKVIFLFGFVSDNTSKYVKGIICNM